LITVTIMVAALCSGWCVSLDQQNCSTLGRILVGWVTV